MEQLWPFIKIKLNLLLILQIITSPKIKQTLEKLFIKSKAKNKL